MRDPTVRSSTKNRSRHFRLVDNVERVDHVVETELNRLGTQLVLIELAPVERPTSVEKPALQEGALLVVRAEMLSDPIRERQREFVEADQLCTTANLEQRAGESELVRRDVLTEQHIRPPVRVERRCLLGKPSYRTSTRHEPESARYDRPCNTRDVKSVGQ